MDRTATLEKEKRKNDDAAIHSTKENRLSSASASKHVGGWRNLKSLATRLGFIVHVVILIGWALLRSGGKKGSFFETIRVHWWLIVCAVPLVAETLFACVYSELVHKGAKKLLGLKWFSHAIFMYLVAAVPPIWVMEGGAAYQEFARNSTQTTGTILNLNIKQEILLAEQTILLIIILGRWFLPKGHLSRDELSSLLLVYLGLAADIAEFFQIFDLQRFQGFDVNPDYITVVLAVWTLSLFQFTLPLTAKPLFSKLILGDDNDEEELPVFCEEIEFDPSLSEKERKRERRKSEQLQKKKQKELQKEMERRRRAAEKKRKQLEKAAQGTLCCSMETWSTWLTIFMQDGPFLAVRLVAIIEYQAYEYNIFYFAAKNLIVILLLLYRFITLACLPGIRGKMMRAQQQEVLQKHTEILQEERRLSQVDQSNTSVDLLPSTSECSQPRHSSSASLPPPRSTETRGDGYDNHAFHLL